MNDALGIGSIADLAKTAIDKWLPDADEKLKLSAAAEMAQLAQDNAIQLAQIKVNEVSAAQGSLARDAYLWVGVAGLALNYLIAPFFNWAASVWGFSLFPVVDLSALNELSWGLLGLGSVHSVSHAYIAGK